MHVIESAIIVHLVHDEFLYVVGIELRMALQAEHSVFNLPDLVLGSVRVAQINGTLWQNRGVVAVHCMNDETAKLYLELL